jgi:dTDP-glucose 4,6-dehydratase
MGRLVRDNDDLIVIINPDLNPVGKRTQLLNLKILVTGGAGFIGSNLIRHLIARTAHEVVNVDKLTYAGNLESLSDVAGNPRYAFIQTDICDLRKMRDVLGQHRPDAVMHLAAESHVDRSIDAPADFIQTNVVGTFHLLQAAREYWERLASPTKERFRFVHVSTDEVFGSLTTEAGPFDERSPYDPRSPYSSSKAASDHFARSWHDTYGLPVIVTNSSNNYGPYQFPEKLVPLVILKALRAEPIPVYGDGVNVRDWLYVNDHAEALYAVLEHGRSGETYLIGGNNEWRNIDLVRMLCRILDTQNPSAKASRHEELITFVTDRPGHDFRYAINSNKIRTELGWQPRETLESGLHKTVQWYLQRRDWWEGVLNGKYGLERLGLQAPLKNSGPLRPHS